MRNSSEASLRARSSTPPPRSGFWAARGPPRTFAHYSLPGQSSRSRRPTSALFLSKPIGRPPRGELDFAATAHWPLLARLRGHSTGRGVRTSRLRTATVGRLSRILRAENRGQVWVQRAPRRPCPPRNDRDASAVAQSRTAMRSARSDYVLVLPPTHSQRVKQRMSPKVHELSPITPKQGLLHSSTPCKLALPVSPDRNVSQLGFAPAISTLEPLNEPLFGGPRRQFRGRSLRCSMTSVGLHGFDSERWLRQTAARRSWTRPRRWLTPPAPRASKRAKARFPHHALGDVSPRSPHCRDAS